MKYHNKITMLILFLFSVDKIVAPNIAEFNSWNLHDSTSYFERFHPVAFDPITRAQIQAFLHEFESVDMLLREHCLPQVSSAQCRETILRGGVLLRQLPYPDSRCKAMITLLDDFRKHIGLPCFSDDHDVIEMCHLLHDLHYELQRPIGQLELKALAQKWETTPKFFVKS